MCEIKTIAFYLPQFHSIPENDKSYGEGFTEWTNVRKAKPIFEGHNQPRIPMDGNYYNLLDISVMREQAKLAKEYGVYGFCYYHYWFSGGKKLLEKPLEAMLKDSSVDIPFCLCWANENWTRRWDGGNNEVIVAQDYGDEVDIKNHVKYLIDFFSDSRYIRHNGKPILIIYKPELIMNGERYIKRIREVFKEYGYDVEIVFQFPDGILIGNYDRLCDYYIEFEPTYSQKLKIVNRRNKLSNLMHRIYMSSQFSYIRNSLRRKKRPATLQILDYDEEWNRMLGHKVMSKKAIAGAFVDWDNTPRKKNGIVYTGVTPQKFQYYFAKLVNKVECEYNLQMIFINAWNEWGEGCYLEADTKFGLSYLKAIKDTLEQSKKGVRNHYNDR